MGGSRLPADALGTIDPNDSALDPRPLPHPEGSDAAQSLRNSLDLAQPCEKLGYQRYWLAEHHGMPGIASAATAVLHRPRRRRHLDHPRRRRRHHAAEPLAAGHRGAVRHAGVAVSRAASTSASAARRAPTSARPGRCAATCQSDRRPVPAGRRRADGLTSEPEPRPAGAAVPGAGLDVPIWILGSSLFGAQLAAASGPALRLRLALRAGADDAGDRDLSRHASSRRSSLPAALRDARLQRVRGRHRRRGRACSPPRCSRPS